MSGRSDCTVSMIGKDATQSQLAETVGYLNQLNPSDSFLHRPR